MKMQFKFAGTHGNVMPRAAFDKVFDVFWFIALFVTVTLGLSDFAVVYWMQGNDFENRCQDSKFIVTELENTQCIPFFTILDLS